MLGGYVASCGVLMLASYVMAMMLGQDPTSVYFGVPVKNEATQSGEFVTCIFGLLYLSLDVCRAPALGADGCGSRVDRSAWLVDILFIATGRTALVIVPLLLAVFAVKKLSTKGPLYCLRERSC